MVVVFSSLIVAGMALVAGYLLGFSHGAHTRRN